MTRSRPTRAEIRARHRPDGAGVYGVSVLDAGADSWTGLYLCRAADADHARRRIREAGFHKKHIQGRWTPTDPPPRVPGELADDDERWFRCRYDDDGWGPWEPLPRDYRHPSPARGAVDPPVR
ncbi:hypothetical protein [Cellulosimicrobium sp. NPDC057862]|uniref:hypothetical protein n=1 Tax=Cellulosimicrobium sp. NPDC057862 TaxID=3346266 RepID=UPI0036718ABC